MKKVIYTLSFVILVILALAGIWSFIDKDVDDNEKQLVQNKEVHAEVAFAQGEIFRKVDNSWLELNSGDILSTGDIIRTNTASRVSLMFDDGSVLRLDENTEIELTDLTFSKIQIAEVQGNTYSRVTKIDDRVYIMTYDNLEVKALGTIFTVKVNDDQMQVKVYESKVNLKTQNIETELNTGEQAVLSKTKQDLHKESFDLTLDDSDFVKWNVQQDLEISHQTEIAEEPEVIEAIDDAEKIEVEKQAEFDQAASSSKDFSIKATNLGNGQINLTWHFVGYDLKDGFKIVWLQNSDELPFYPEPQDGYKYFTAEAAQKISNGLGNYSTSINFNKNGNYKIRVCRYVDGKCDLATINYVVVKVDDISEKPEPKTTDKVQSINLTGVDEVVSWSLIGYSGSGFKVVWSKNSNPTYPTRNNDKYLYYSNPDERSAKLTAFDGSGKYYVRVCEYLGGKCGVYSNQIEVNLE